LWGNSTFGLFIYWWHANKQQAGRGSILTTTLESLPVLDVAALTKTALSKAVATFDEMKHRDLKPFNEIDRDPVRAELDYRLANEVLGFPNRLLENDGPLDLLRRKLALEPSITGGKAVS